MITEAVLSREYDLVIVLTPTREILNERLWIQQAPEGVTITNLKPRPRERCGAVAQVHHRREGEVLKQQPSGPDQVDGQDRGPEPLEVWRLIRELLGKPAK